MRIPGTGLTCVKRYRDKYIDQCLIRKLRQGKQWYLNHKTIAGYSEYISEHPKSKNPRPRALVSYLVAPLLPIPECRDKEMFSNPGIAQYIPRALNELGYTVDIVNYNNNAVRLNKEYDLFIGHGGINYEVIDRQLTDSCTRIYFSTGTYWQDMNDQEDERIAQVEKRKGVWLPRERWIKDSEEYANTHADGIICLGNQHTKGTYNKFLKVIAINNAVFPDNYQRCCIQGSRDNWLFFNGGGNVHKGLDLVLEAFAGLPDQNLYVRQNLQPEFEAAYRKELYGTPNIHVLRYLQRPDKDFYDLMNTCQFVITPSCAEGQPGSVLECMAHGLIPVLSKECNIDTDYIGETLKENTVQEIRNVVRKMSMLSGERLETFSHWNQSEIRANYSPENFLQSFKSAVVDIENGRTR